MTEYIVLFFKGFIVGIGKIIPGVSGAMLAISLGVYDKGLDAVGNFFKDIKKNTIFLLVAGFGVLLAISSFSNLIFIALKKYYLATMLLFCGVIAGTIPELGVKLQESKKPYYYLFSAISFLFLVSFVKLMSFIWLPTSNLYFYYFLMGIMEAISIILPGISGTALLLNFGCYENIIGAIGKVLLLKISVVEVSILLPFTVGLIAGIFFLAKILSNLLKRYTTIFNFIIIGNVVASLILMLLETLKYSYDVKEVILSFVFLVLGYFISSFFAKLS